MSHRRFQEIAVGILVAGGLIIFIFLAFKVGGASWGRKNTYIIKARDVLGLVENSSVMIAGVEIGRIKKLDVENGTAIITVSIDGKYRLTRGTRFYIRGKSLLGEKYLDVVPGPSDASPLPTGKLLDIWADHETEIGDFVTKIDRNYMPSPDEVKELMSSLLVLLSSRREEIVSLIDWLYGVSKEIKPEDVGFIVDEMKIDLKWVGRLRQDYMAWRWKFDRMLDFGVDLSEDYEKFRDRMGMYEEYAPSPTDVGKIMTRLDRLIDQTSELLCNLNFQLHKFDNVDFETVMEILEDRGFKVRFWGRSAEQKKRDMKLFRSYPSLTSGESCK